MTTVLEQINNEKLNHEAFDHLPEEMKGTVLQALAEELRNEEIMAKLSLTEKELKGLFEQYDIVYSFRNLDRRLDGDKIVSEEELEDILAKNQMNFTDLLQYERSSQRKIVYALIERAGKFSETVRNVFGVKFYNFFTSLYHEEKALLKKGKTTQIPTKKTEEKATIQPTHIEAKSPVQGEIVTTPTLQEQTEVKPILQEENIYVPEVQSNWMEEGQMPTEDELYTYLTTPTENNPNDLNHLNEPWESPFGIEKKYMIQLKDQKATKRQMKARLRYLLDEMDELADDALLSMDVKITEHTLKK